MKASEKEYWRKRSTTHKTICEKCNRYMQNAYVQTKVNGVRTSVKVGLICKCGWFLKDKEGLEKIAE
jgi:RNase P subunit RPR2